MSSDWSLDADQYKFISIIGKGSFSKVLQAEYANDKKLVAVKIMDLENVSSSFEDVLQEVQTMKLSNHQNILRCYCSFVESNQLWLVMQLMNLGSCLRVMKLSKSINKYMGLKEEWISYILHETMNGLNYLHGNGQIHRDIKSGNILLDSQGGVRLADFGVSGWTVARGVRQDTVKTFVGTPCYMAPEVMEQTEGYDSKADIWSVGITALELAKGYAPYAHLAPMRVLVLTIEEDPPSLKSYPSRADGNGHTFSSVYEEFCNQCLQKNPKTRPNAEELLRHRFLRGHGNDRIRDSFATDFLHNIPPVGSEAASATHESQKLPGETAVEVTVERWNFDSMDGDSFAFSNSSRSDIAPVVQQYGLSGRPPVVDARSSSFESLKSLDPQFQEKRAKPVSESSGRYVAGTTWIFDGDDIDELGGNSGIVERKSDRPGFASQITEKYRISVHEITGDAGHGDAAVNRQTAGSIVHYEYSRNEHGNEVKVPEIDDFLTDFEKEIVLSTITDRTDSAIVMSTPIKPDPPVLISPSHSAPIPHRSQSTESFMDELEDIVDGKG